MDKKLEVINRKNSTTINIYDVNNFNLNILDSLNIVENNLEIDFKKEVKDPDKIIDVINYFYRNYKFNFIFLIEEDTKNSTLIKGNYKKCSAIINSDKLEKEAEKLILIPTPTFACYETFITDFAYICLNQIKEVEQFIALYSKEINNSGLSNFEKVLATYNTVIKLLRYKKEESDRGASCRNIYYIFQKNSSIVCMGYVNILKRLLTECGISSSIVFNDNKSHAQIMINIVDDKYQIHGNYLSDPTTDSIKYFLTKDTMRDLFGEESTNNIIPLMTMINYFCLTKEEYENCLSQKGIELGTIELTGEKVENLLSLTKISNYKKINALYNVNSYIFKDKMQESDFLEACINTLSPIVASYNMNYKRTKRIVDKTVQKRKVYAKN